MKKNKIKTDDPYQLSFEGRKYMDTTDLQLYAYNAEQIDIISKDVIKAAISEVNAESQKWLNLNGIHDVALIQKLAKKLQLHSSIPRKVIDTEQSHRLIDYDEHYYFGIHNVPESKDAPPEKISFLFRKNLLLTVQEKSNKHFEHIRKRLAKNSGKARQKQIDYLIFLMLESIIDNYAAETDRLSEKLENIYKDIKNLKELDALETLREEFSLVKIYFMPIKDTIKSLPDVCENIFDDSNEKHFKFLKDWADQILDDINFALQKIESGVNLFFSYQNQRLNEVMKTLTLVSVIFIPITFIAGVYGMNFHNMPELSMPYGYFAVLGLMFAISVAFLLFFRKRRWF
jgi:magnesium transporter